MLSLQGDIRVLVNAGLGCSESSIRLLAMRVEMVDLIRQRDAMGGREACPNIAEQKKHHRPELRRRFVIAKEKPGRSRVLSMVSGGL
jgi:hypothetical protein